MSSSLTQERPDTSACADTLKMKSEAGADAAAGKNIENGGLTAEGVYVIAA